MQPCYRVRLVHEPPYAVRFGRYRWRIVLEVSGKNGRQAALMARCADGREIPILAGRERAAHQLGCLTTRPGTLLHELWLRLAARGAVVLVEIPRRPPRPRGRYLDCGGNVFVPLPAGGGPLTIWQVEALCREARSRVGRAPPLPE